MVRGKELSAGKHAQVILLNEMGFKQRQIAIRLQVSRCAVQRCLSRSKELVGDGLQSRKRSGRPKVTSRRTDNSIIMMSKHSPRASLAKIKAQLPVSEKVSTRTIRKRLFTGGLKARRPAKKPLLSAINICDRLTFCKKYRNWSADD